MTLPSASGQVAVVTGAGAGIGRAIALAFARAGALVIAAGRSIESLTETRELILSENGKAEVELVDVRDADSLGALADSVLLRHGCVDTLIANSGISGPTAPSWEIGLDEWNDVITTNLTGVFLSCRAFLPSMIERQEGSIVVIGSITGKRPMLGRTPYAASKLGVVGFVRSLAADVGCLGVRANVISPGPTEGNRLQRVFDEQARATGQTALQVRNEFVASTPLRRLVTGSDIADCALFLASPAAHAITGQDINVTAGFVMH